MESKREILDLLESTKNSTKTFFELPEQDLQKTYGPGKWSIAQILHHLADAETVLYDRIRRVISEPKAVLWSFEQDLWAIGLEYESLPLVLSRDLYLASRARLIYHVERNFGVKAFSCLFFASNSSNESTIRWRFFAYLELIRYGAESVF